jgi:hypothetical protein
MSVFHPSPPACIPSCQCRTPPALIAIPAAIFAFLSPVCAAARPHCRHSVVHPFATAVVPLLLHSTSPAAVSVAAGQQLPPSCLSLHHFCCCTPGLRPPPLPVSHLLTSTILSASLSATRWYIYNGMFLSPSPPTCRLTVSTSSPLDASVVAPCAADLQWLKKPSGCLDIFH